MILRAMISRLYWISFNTYREAVRDRVLYNLIIFALLMVGSAPFISQVSIGMERVFLINVGLTSISVFGVVIAVFLGMGLVSKEIDRKTLYTVLSRPVRRWEFITGKFFGLSATLMVNAAFMSLGLFLILFYVARSFQHEDKYILIAIYFIVLQLLIITALALLFSSFSTPIFSAVFSLCMFILGSLSADLRSFANSAQGVEHQMATVAAYLVPNLSSLNVIARVAHDQTLSPSLIFYNTAYSLLYIIAVLSLAILIFEYRNLK